MFYQLTLLHISYILFFCLFPLGLFIFYMFLSVLLYAMYMYIVCMHDEEKGHNMGSTPLELVLQWL